MLLYQILASTIHAKTLLAQLLDISPKNFIFLKIFNSGKIK